MTYAPQTSNYPVDVVARPVRDKRRVAWLETLSRLLHRGAALVRSPPRTRTRDLPKFKEPGEDLRRKRSAWVAAASAVVFAGLAVACAVTARSWVPLPFGSGLLVECALLLAPQLWPVAVLHNAVLALVATLLLFACTTAHVEIPGDPRSATTRVWRRQEAFAAPAWLTSAALLITGIVLHVEVHPLAGAVVESTAAGMALHALVRTCVPIARLYFVVEFDPARGGVGNRVTVGGGLSLRGRPVLVIFHDQLISADVETTPWEFCFGLATLCLRYRDDHDGTERTVRVRALGSAMLVQWMAHQLRGEFKLARKRSVLDNVFSVPVQPWQGGAQATH